jgi:hypothetical protein
MDAATIAVTDDDFILDEPLSPPPGNGAAPAAASAAQSDPAASSEPALSESAAGTAPKQDATKTPLPSDADKRKLAIQTQINGLIRTKAQTQAEYDALQSKFNSLRQEYDRLEQQASARKAPAATDPAQAHVDAITTLKVGDQPFQPTRPMPEEGQFDNYSDYTKAMTRWAVEKNAEYSRQLFDHKQQESRAGIERESRDRAATEFAAKRDERVAELRKQHADFDAIVAENTDLQVHNAIDSYFVQMEDGPAVFYHLVTHLDELDRLNQMLLSQTPRGFVELGRLSERLSAASSQSGTAPKPIPVTNAKPPITPVGSSPDASDDAAVDLDSLSDDEFVRVMNERDRKRGRRL